MTSRDTSGRIDRLEHARAELESVLAGHSDWRVLRRTSSAATRAALERALQDDAVYRAWRLLDQVIAEMRAEAAAQPTVGLAPPDEAQDHRHRVSLRDVLASIRTDGASPLDDEPVTPLVPMPIVPMPVVPMPEPAAAVGTAGPEPAEAYNAGPTLGHPPLPAADDQGEATVSFVVRELGPEPEPELRPELGPEPGPPPAAPRTRAAPSPPAGQARRDAHRDRVDTVADHEAEVTIVPRRR